MSKKYIFINADETTNAGERDYTLALAQALGTPAAGTICHAFKLNGAKQTAPAPLPRTKADYALLPDMDVHTTAGLANPGDNIDIVAVGSSTLEQAVTVKTDLSRLYGIAANLSYITHKIDSAAQLETLVHNNATVFTTLTREDLSTLDAEHAETVALHHIEAIPHTNTDIGCAEEYQAFMAQQRSHKSHLPGIIERREPFVFAVLNAGFPAGGTHTPYLETEAARDGLMLADKMPAGTHLVLADGGPRNGIDKHTHAQNTMAAFVRGYCTGQAQKDASVAVITAPFSHDPLSPNAVKAGLHMGKMKNCLAFVSNAEGWGTMDGAIRHINNRQRPIYAFPFAAQNGDTAHQSNLSKYNTLGITLLHSQTGVGLPALRETPLPVIDSAANILGALGIKSAPALGLAPLRHTYAG